MASSAHCMDFCLLAMEAPHNNSCTKLARSWSLRKWIMVHEIQKGEVIEENSGPSLREIVEQYIDERWPADKKSEVVEKTSGSLPESNMGRISTRENTKVDKKSEEVEKTSDSLPENNMGRISTRENTKVDKKSEEVEKTSGSLPENNMGRISTREDTKVENFIEQVLINEQDDLEGWLKLAIRKVLQEEEVKDLLKAIMKEAFKEEREREKQPREVSNSYEDSKGEISLLQGTTVKENQKTSHKARNNGKSKAKDEEEEREEWRKLRETLSRYNVSMDCIQAFQKFRFYCDPGHLPWPLPEQA